MKLMVLSCNRSSNMGRRLGVDHLYFPSLKNGCHKGGTDGPSLKLAKKM